MSHKTEEKTMLRKFTFAALAATMLTSAPLPVEAQESIFIPLLTYRTGAFAGSGVHIANGMRDYLEMLNQRDGGIGGVKLVIEECETGYDTKKGVECYESMKGKNPVVHNPYSTGITLQLIPKAAVDKVPILSMAYGLSASADGENFPWIFNPPVTYWDGASVFIKHVAAVEGGFDKLKGKVIGLVHLDAPFGKEPIPVLEALAKQYGFELKLYPVPAAQMQNQGSQWLGIRRDKVDWVYNQGWGAMNPTAVKEAIKSGFPIDKLVGVWWAGGDDDARAGEAAAKGYKTLNFHNTGANYPALQDVLKHVHDKNLTQAKREQVGENLYNRGVFNSFLIAEAIRTAQAITGKKAVTGEDVRKGFEALNITEARLKEAGFEGFANTIKIACNDHNGHNKVFISQWDGTKYVKASDWIEPMKDKVRPLIEEAAKDFVSKNDGWPKRTEACAKGT
jgi:branched-chain amino acid transport system substrate-binding protein